MAVVLRASANATTGAAAAQTLTITKPAATATGETLLAHLAVSGGSAVRVLAPSGWALVRQTNSGTSLSLLTYQRQAASGEAATYTWVFDSARNACGVVRTYRNNTASSFCRVVAETGQSTPSGTSHEAASLTSNVASQMMVCAFSSYVQDTWGPDALQTESDDTTTTLGGAGDVCLQAADDTLSALGATGVRTSTLDSGTAVGCTHSCLISADGATQASGTGNSITIFDDTKSASAVSYNFAELSVSYPNDIAPTGATNLRASYRSKVNLIIGKTTAGTTTTLADTNVCVLFDASTGISTPSTTLGSWNINLGTKVGTGDNVGGKAGAWLSLGTNSTLRGNLRLYGSSIACDVAGGGAATLTIAPGLAGLTSDVQACLLSVASTATANLVIGGTTIPLGNIHNVIMTAAPISLTTTALSLFNATAAKHISISGPNNVTMQSSASDSINTKDMLMSGNTPATSDLRWGGSPGSLFDMVQPAWSQGGSPKCSTQISNIPTLANAMLEWWLWNVKVVNASGAAISNIPVKLTDTIGNVQVNTTTDSNGRVSFGSGIKANAVTVMDHYSVGTTYTQRHRSPFLVEINTGNSKNTDYQSLRGYFYWPGYESVTTTAGNFEDVNTMIHLQTAAGAPTTWIEMEQA